MWSLPVLWILQHVLMGFVPFFISSTEAINARDRLQTLLRGLCSTMPDRVKLIICRDFFNQRVLARLIRDSDGTKKTLLLAQQGPWVFGGVKVLSTQWLET